MLKVIVKENEADVKDSFWGGEGRRMVLDCGIESII